MYLLNFLFKSDIVVLNPDRSEVEIQYAAVYTEGILPSIQCTCSVSEIAVYDHTAHTLQHSSSIPAVILQTSWSVHSVYTATILPYTVSLLHFSQGNVQGSSSVLHLGLPGIRFRNLEPKKDEYWLIMLCKKRYRTLFLKLDHINKCHLHDTNSF